jgi:MIP family channel proteins
LATNSWGSVTSGGDLLTIATAFGFAIALLVYSVGHISGGHINPAVSFALFLLKEIDAKTFAAYFVAHFSGATLGSLILWGSVASLTYDCDDYDAAMALTVPVCTQTTIKSDGSYGPPFGLGVNALSPRNKIGSAFLIELVGTYLLLFAVLMTAVHKKSTAGNAAPIAIGWAVMMAHIVMIPYTGCGINPARSFGKYMTTTNEGTKGMSNDTIILSLTCIGPMVVNSMGGVNTWSYGWWIYYVAPFVGAGLAAGTYKLLFEDDGDDDEADPKKTDVPTKLPMNFDDDELQEGAA